ncbi:MAG TPA: hypothetical protein VK207_06260, partial [Bacteroidales bacterium]|nr:hypothetical protein [Bacteroidales bacterium]
MFKNHLKTALTGLFICLSLSIDAQKIATLEVTLDKPAGGLEIPVQVSLDEVTLLPDSVISLSEVKGSSRTQVSFQIEAGNPRILHWVVIPSGTKPGEKHVYEVYKSPLKQKMLAETIMQDGELTIHKGDKNLLRYVYKTVYPPKGV